MGRSQAASDATTAIDSRAASLQFSGCHSDALFEHVSANVIKMVDSLSEADTHSDAEGAPVSSLPGGSPGAPASSDGEDIMPQAPRPCLDPQEPLKPGALPSGAAQCPSAASQGSPPGNLNVASAALLQAQIGGCGTYWVPVTVPIQVPMYPGCSMMANPAGCSMLPNSLFAQALPLPVSMPQLVLPQQTPVPTQSKRESETPILPKPVKQQKDETGGHRTTVMLRNMPNNYTRKMLVELLDSQGFAAQYDFIYLPIDFESKACLGYAFVNLVDTNTALRFWKVFDGFNRWVIPSRKVSGVSWSGPHQGYQSHVERYRNSSLMGETTPDEYKPAVFRQGVRVSFPEPTRSQRVSRNKGSKVQRPKREA